MTPTQILLAVVTMMQIVSPGSDINSVPAQYRNFLEITDQDLINGMSGPTNSSVVIKPDLQSVLIKRSLGYPSLLQIQAQKRLEYSIQSRSKKQQRYISNAKKRGGQQY